MPGVFYAGIVEISKNPGMLRTVQYRCSIGSIRPSAPISTRAQFQRFPTSFVEGYIFFGYRFSTESMVLKVFNRRESCPGMVDVLRYSALAWPGGAV